MLQNFYHGSNTWQKTNLIEMFMSSRSFLFLFSLLYARIRPSLPSIDRKICGKRLIDHHERDTNEHLTHEGDWPWNAAIYRLSFDVMTFKCLGTLIHSNIVLTSATCVFEYGRKIVARATQVQLGKFNFSETGSNVQMLQVNN